MYKQEIELLSTLVVSIINPPNSLWHTETTIILNVLAVTSQFKMLRPLLNLCVLVFTATAEHAPLLKLKI